MVMKKINLMLALAASALLFSCNNNGGSVTIPSPKTQGYWILGEGSFGVDNSTLYYYDLSTQTATNRFETANPEAVLGNTANDMKVYGSKLYVAVDMSNKVVVLNALTGEILQEIDMGTEDGLRREPRNVTYAAGKVYVSLYSGQVARIDTTTFAVDYTPYGGSFTACEGIVAVGEHTLVVANSGQGTGKTVTLYDVATFSSKGDITVPTNPCELAVADDQTVYLATWTVYDATFTPIAPAALHKLDLTQKTYTTLEGVEVQRLAINGQILYGVNTAYDESYKMTSTLVKLDLRSGDKTEMLSEEGVSYNGVNVNPLNGYVYVSKVEADYKTSTILPFDEKGNALTPVTGVGNAANTVAFVNKLQ